MKPKSAIVRGFWFFLSPGKVWIGEWMADLECTGLSKLQSNVWLPHTRRKGAELGDWEKGENREHLRKRSVIEHVVGRLSFSLAMMCVGSGDQFLLLG